MGQNLGLDNRIYLLQHTQLPQELRSKVSRADVAYLQDKDAEAAQLITEVEQACAKLGIQIAAAPW